MLPAALAVALMIPLTQCERPGSAQAPAEETRPEDSPAPPAPDAPALDSAAKGPSDPAPPQAAETTAPGTMPGLPSSTPAPAVPRAVRTGPVFSLPTANDALLKDAPAQFFMFVDRYVNSQTLQVWEGGDYGFVRNPRKTSSGEVFTKFHEGIDIAPVSRDEKGEPQDPVMAIADGKVAYITPPGAGSNYGNYVVIAHDCGPRAGRFYSLYAHLQSASTLAGATVKRGDVIGKMGHTGAGIDRRRSHVHLEICFLLSERYDDCYRSEYKLPNGHGNFNGTNLIGLDPADFLLAAHRDPGLTPDEFLQSREPAWKVVVPNHSAGELELVERHPFLRQPGPVGKSWEISFDSAGVPLRVEARAMSVPVPAVTWVKPCAGYHSWNTRNLLTGSGTTAGLSPEGRRYVRLVCGDFAAPAPPPAPAEKIPPATVVPIPATPVRK